MSLKYPEYSKSKAAREQEIKALENDAVVMRNNINKMEREESQSRGNEWAELHTKTEAYKLQCKNSVDSKMKAIDRRDSINCAPYEQKYQQAWNDMMKGDGVFYIYDSKDAFIAWKKDEAEFIDLNRAFAAKLN